MTNNLGYLKLKLIRSVNKILSRNHKRKILKDKSYLDNMFSVYNRKTLDSVNLKTGIVLGKYEKTYYLMAMEPGDFIESHIFMDGIWERHITNLIGQYLDKPNSIMIDVGANIGATSIPLAKTHSNVKFYCFEPHPTVFAKLDKNVKINKLDNLFPVNSVISGSESETITFYAQKKSSNMGLSSTKLNYDLKEYDTIKTSNTTLDNFFKDIDSNIVVIKIDTQGSEHEVLSSANGIISRHKPVILFEFEDEYYSSPKERMDAANFITGFFDSNNYMLVSINKNIDYFPTIDLSKYYHGDILAIPL